MPINAYFIEAAIILARKKMSGTSCKVHFVRVSLKLGVFSKSDNPSLKLSKVIRNVLSTF